MYFHYSFFYTNLLESKIYRIYVAKQLSEFFDHGQFHIQYILKTYLLVEQAYHLRYRIQVDFRLATNLGHGVDKICHPHLQIYSQNTHHWQQLFKVCYTVIHCHRRQKLISF